MGNIVHYVRQMSEGNEYYSLKYKLRIILVSLILYHALLTFAFFINGTTPLVAYNFVVVLYYVVVIGGLVRKESFASAMSFTVCEVVLCSLFSTICTGMQTGFAIYTIGAISSCFYIAFVINANQRQDFISFVTSLIMVLCYVLNYVISIYIKPLAPIESVFWIRAFYISNYVITAVMIMVFTYLIVWEVRNNATKLKKQNELLNELAHKDPLTHLYNRRSMNDILAESMVVLKNKGKRFSLILGDIDNFKKVNDVYGHDAGDAVLKKVAEVISECVGSQGSVCRWGGEEILVLINASIETASTIAERVRSQIENTVVTCDSTQIRVTMTLGVSESIPGYKIENLIQIADDRLYYGKDHGKNQVVSSSPMSM